MDCKTCGENKPRSDFSEAGVARKECLQCCSASNVQSYKDRQEYLAGLLNQRVIECKEICSICSMQSSLLKFESYSFEDASGKKRSIRGTSTTRMSEFFESNNNLICPTCVVKRSLLSVPVPVVPVDPAVVSPTEEKLPSSKKVNSERSLQRRKEHLVKDSFDRKTCDRCPLVVDNDNVRFFSHQPNPDAEKTVSQLVHEGVAWERFKKAIAECALLCPTCQKAGAPEGKEARGSNKAKVEIAFSVLKNQFVKQLASYSDRIQAVPPPIGTTSFTKEEKVKGSITEPMFKQNRTTVKTLRTAIAAEMEWIKGGMKEANIPKSIRKYRQPVLVIRDAYLNQFDKWMIAGRKTAQPNLKQFLRSGSESSSSSASSSSAGAPSQIELDKAKALARQTHSLTKRTGKKTKRKGTSEAPLHTKKSKSK